MLTFGTGIGGGAIVQDEIYRGVGGAHPELGHVPASADGPECYCGIRGCLESIASGTAIASAGKDAGFSDAREVFAAAANGHPRAAAVLAEAKRAAVSGAWTICHTLLPERLVLGGGIMEEHFAEFAAAIENQFRKATQFPGRAVSVAKAALGNEAGIVGAAALALRNVRRPPS
jgi:glucokinase